MHRLSALGSLFLAAGLVACGPPKQLLKDAPHVDRLRARITKARNAIEETRAALGRAQGTVHQPELQLRLAELLSEEARYHYQVAYEREQHSTKSLHVPQARVLKEQSISLYKQLRRRHPDAPQAPRVLFNLGQEHRELGEFEEMRKVLGELVERHTKSPLRSEALIVLGDDHFDRGQLNEAAEAYKKVDQGPLTQASGLARYKLAWVYVNQGDCKGALRSFEQAIDVTRRWRTALTKGASRAHAGVASNLDVRREALVDLTYCYSRERKPRHATRYLRARADSRDIYVAALEKLASRYNIMSQAEGATLIARELLVSGPDNENRVDEARMLYTALRQSKDFREVGNDVRLITRAYLREQRKVNTPEATRKQLFEEFETYARDLATRADDAAQKKGRPPKRKKGYKPKTQAELRLEATRAYVAYLEAFPETEQRLAMLENLADALADLDHDFEAARRYVEVARQYGDDSNEKSEALFNAVIHFQDSLEAKNPTTRMQRVVARAGLRVAGRALIARQLGGDRARKVKFAVAQTYYDEGRLDEAVDQLTAVAFEYPQTPEGDAAVHLTLDALNTAHDLLGLVSAGHRFGASDSPVSAKVKGEIKPIIAAAEQRQLDELSLIAGGEDGGGQVQELEDLASRYENTSMGERALLNAFVAARSSGDSEGLYRLAERIQKTYPKSEQLPGIMSTVARTAAARFELDRAVSAFSKAAEVNESQRVQLLVAEGELRAELGDTGGARGTLERALKAAKSPAAAARPAATLARLMEAGDAKRAVSRLSGLTQGGPDVLAALGLAQIRAGQADEAEGTLQQVLDAGATASDEALARAHYGQAEIFYAALKGYEPENDLESVTELATLIEVTEQSYLKAARQGSRDYTAAALGRLAHLSQTQAKRLRGMKPPSGVDAAMAANLKRGLGQRADQLDKNAAQALKACAEQGWSHHIFNAGVRACLSGQPPAQDPVRPDALKQRAAAGEVAGAAELRTRISKNPDDLDALRQLGELLLDAGDAHSARLVFARAAAAGGGPIELNLLGIASHRAGDLAGGLSGFAQAAAGGLEAGRQNLSAALAEAGLSAAAEEALKRWPQGREGGRSLGGAR